MEDLNAAVPESMSLPVRAIGTALGVGVYLPLYASAKSVNAVIRETLAAVRLIRAAAARLAIALGEAAAAIHQRAVAVCRSAWTWIRVRVLSPIWNLASRAVGFIVGLLVAVLVVLLAWLVDWLLVRPARLLWARVLAPAGRFVWDLWCAGKLRCKRQCERWSASVRVVLRRWRD